MVRNDSAPCRPSRVSSSARLRETWPSAASAQAKTAAPTTSSTTTVMTRTSPVTTAPFSQLGPSPIRQELVGEAEHDLLVLRLGVVVAEQVQHAMRAQHGELLLERVAGGGRLLRRELRADDD